MILVIIAALPVSRVRGGTANRSERETVPPRQPVAELTDRPPARPRSSRGLVPRVGTDTPSRGHSLHHHRAPKRRHCRDWSLGPTAIPTARVLISEKLLPEMAKKNTTTAAPKASPREPRSGPAASGAVSVLEGPHRAPAGPGLNLPRSSAAGGPGAAALGWGEPRRLGSASPVPGPAPFRSVPPRGGSAEPGRPLHACSRREAGTGPSRLRSFPPLTARPSPFLARRPLAPEPAPAPFVPFPTLAYTLVCIKYLHYSSHVGLRCEHGSRRRSRLGGMQRGSARPGPARPLPRPLSTPQPGNLQSYR